MKRINKGMGVAEFAAAVAVSLKAENIRVILVGGAVVSIYSKNKYESRDIDFLSNTDHDKIIRVMSALGFEQKGKDFYHTHSPFSVEFPGRTLIIGEQQMKPDGKIKINGFELKLLSPTQCVMDRLAAFYHWSDRQALDQAILVTENQPINLAKVKAWSNKEGMAAKFEIFRAKLKRK